MNIMAVIRRLLKNSFIRSSLLLIDFGNEAMVWVLRLDGPFISLCAVCVIIVLGHIV